MYENLKFTFITISQTVFCNDNVIILLKWLYTNIIRDYNVLIIFLNKKSLSGILYMRKYSIQTWYNIMYN